MADPFVAEIRIFPFNFAPTGWAFCDGQLMPISQNTALFSLLGTTYGGDGKTNFALPNLQGSAPMHPGQGVGLSLHDLGETGGSDTVSLLESEMPSHSHAVRANSDIADVQSPQSGPLARPLPERLRLPDDDQSGLGLPRPPSANSRRRRPAPQQPATLPDLLLLHRASGGLPAERVGQRSGTIKTTIRYLPLF